jgi:hypothetical protein
MTVNVTLRATKGSALTHAEMDNNFSGLKQEFDSLAEQNSSISVGGFSAGSLNISVPSIKALGTVPLINGRVYNVVSFYDGWAALLRPPLGGGLLVYDATRLKNNHNGVKVIDPLKIQTWNGTLSDLSTLFSSSTAGIGCFIRVCDASSLQLTQAGADPYGSANSFAAIQKLVSITPAGGRVVVDGYFRCGSAIQVNKNISFVGIESRLTNLPDFTLSTSTIYFDDGSPVGIENTGATLTVDGVILVGTGVGDGIRSSGAGNSVLMKGDWCVQSFETGIRVTEGYYSKLNTGVVTFCKNGVVVDYCYNFQMFGTTIRANGEASQGLTLLNGSQVNMFGGSIENCLTFGCGVYQNSSLNLNGVYFENEGGYNVQLGNGASVSAIQCNVYLNTGANRFISVENTAVSNIKVFARNNTLNVPSDSSVANAYVGSDTDTNSFWDLSGDTWPTTAGASVTYFSGRTSDMAGKVKISYPLNHPLAAKISKVIDDQSNSVATTVANLATDFNSLLAKLRSAGFMS